MPYAANSAGMPYTANLTVDEITSRRSSVFCIRHLFDIVDDEPGSAAWESRASHNTPIDEDHWLKHGDIITVDGSHVYEIASAIF